MKICAIICEYNPLHSGHVHQLEAARKLTGCDTVLCIMSGNFVQRGQPAIAGKLFRARCAVESGADIVLELPAAFALSSAQDFAHMGVAIAAAAGAQALLFGSESGDLRPLRARALALAHGGELSGSLKTHLKRGVSYAKAAGLAEGIDPGSPNDLLGMEYLLAIERLSANISPFTIKRENDYHSGELSGKFISATAARQALTSGKAAQLEGYVHRLDELASMPHSDEEALAAPMLYFLRTADRNALSLANGISEGLENRMADAAQQSGSYAELLQNIKTKRYTMARIRRALLCAFLGITADTVNRAKACEPYLRVLALKDGRTDILSALPKHLLMTGGNLPLADTANEVHRLLFEAESRADALYPLLMPGGVKPEKFKMQIV